MGRGRPKGRKTRENKSQSTGQRKREYYAECRKAMKKLGMDKMETDLMIAEYLSQLPDFEGVDLLYAKGSTMLQGGEPVKHEKPFINYEAIVNKIKGTKGRYVEPVKEFECPHDKKFCKKFIEQMNKHKKPIDKSLVREIKSLRKQGLSIRKIADTMGIPVGTVAKYCRGLSKGDVDGGN